MLDLLKMFYYFEKIIFCFTGLLSCHFVTSISVYPKSVFPVELGETVNWIFSPDSKTVLTEDSLISFEINKGKHFRVHKSHCSGPSEKYFTCTYKPGSEIIVTFTPTEEFHGGDLIIKLYENTDSIWTGVGPILFREMIQLTKQPTFIEMDMHLKEASRFTSVVPTGLRLDPPVFLTSSTVRIDCVTDGSLPPVPITFSVECPPPPTAIVEHDRITQAKQGVPYEKFYRTYGFRSSPTLSDLAPYVARKHASEILRQGHVSSKDNKTLRAVLTVTEKAHDCHVVCRIAGKETRRRMTVYHPTTTAYLLPHPREGYVNVGSEMTCYADGHPPPMISLRLSQPLRPPKPLSEEELETLRQIGRLPKLNGEDPITRELLLERSGLEIIAPQEGQPADPPARNDDSSIATSGALHQLPDPSSGRWFMGENKEPYETSKRIPGIGLSTVERHRQLGLHPNEYSIQGATFRLAANATPGVELLLTCTARNVLPGDTTFLGLNGTIARSRFVVSAISYYSLGIAIGVCAFVLLILIIVILAMLLQRRRQARLGSDTERLAPNGMKKSKTPPKSAYSQGQLAPRAPTTAANSAHSHLRPTSETAGPNLSPNAYTSDPNYRYGSSTHVPALEATYSTPLVQPNAEELQYVELAFDRPSHPPRTGTVPSSRAATALRGGPTSASMTLFGTTPRANHAAQSHGASVPHGLDSAGAWHPDTRPSLPVDDGSSHYTEIVAIMQPKAHSSQLVLQQQQEATQALLSMQQNKPRVFV